METRIYPDGERMRDTWRRIAEQYYEEGRITKNCMEEVVSFLSKGKAVGFLDKPAPYPDTVKEMENALQERFEILGELYARRKRTWGEQPMYENLKRLHESIAVNEEKYVEEFYESTKKFLFFMEIFKGRRAEIEEDFGKKICYKRYGKLHTLSGGYHCPSPVEDLVIDNVSRRRVTKRPPKDWESAVEYDYDEEGRLIMTKCYRQENVRYFTRFLVYGDREICHIQYDHFEDADMVSEFGIQKYEEDLIHTYEYLRGYKGRLSEIRKETYEYQDGLLAASRGSEFMFPNLLRPWHSYVYERDEEGFIKGYHVKEFWGDGERKYPNPDRLVELTSKKRRDTGKNAGRWRRPNYFGESEY